MNEEVNCPSAWVSRRLRLLASPSEAQHEALQALACVDEIVLEVQGIWVRYDVCRLQLPELLTTLRALDCAVMESGWQRLRLSFWAFIDANTADNAQRQSSHCCNRPPPGAGC